VRAGSATQKDLVVSPEPLKKSTQAKVDHGSPVRPIWDKVTIAIFAAVLTWSYWPVFTEMAHKWSSDPQYSHAYLVPVFSLLLVWGCRKTIDIGTSSPCWWGALLLVVGLGLRLTGSRYFVDWLEAVSLLPTIAGAVFLTSGWPSLRPMLPAIAFLGFMIPLPHFVETGLSHPLQSVATKGATYALQTIGRPAFPEGNVIVINDVRIGVIEACNGMGMFLLFFAMAAGVAILIQRPLWEKAILMFSAAPIAVGVNILRIMANSLAHESINSPRVDQFFHDFAGWLMMPLALAALWLELKFLSCLFVEVTPRSESKVDRPASTRGARAARQESAVSNAH
jgi:exosortase